MVFEEKDNPCIIAIYQLSINNKHLKNTIDHISIKSNLFLKYFKQLVIEKFDQKTIKQIHFIENDWMFKVALYGNVLDFKLLKKLEDFANPLKNQIDNIVLFKGGGIHKGTKDNYSPFNEILNKVIIENSEINKYFSQSLLNNRIINKSII